MNAFYAGHRARFFAAGAAQFAPVVCAGPLPVNEFEILPCVFENPFEQILLKKLSKEEPSNRYC
jgi:3-phosphoglycerate kinase